MLKMKNISDHEPRVHLEPIPVYTSPTTVIQCSRSTLILLRSKTWYCCHECKSLGLCYPFLLRINWLNPPPLLCLTRTTFCPLSRLSVSSRVATTSITRTSFVVSAHIRQNPRVYDAPVTSDAYGISCSSILLATQVGHPWLPYGSTSEAAMYEENWWFRRSGRSV